MNDQPEEDGTSDSDRLRPLITLQDLNSTWMGIATAIEWIAIRGQPASIEQHRKREDEAADALAGRLADLPPEIAEPLVKGVSTLEPGPLVPIPSGIWGQTAATEASEPSKPYRLTLTDEDFEWEGAILGLNGPGYRRVQIRTDFVRDNWPEHALDIAPPLSRLPVARAELRRLIEKIVAITPTDLAPLTHREVLDLVKRRMPGASRDVVRDAYSELVPNAKRGPRGPRNPNRNERIKELSDELMAAQLHN